MEESQDSTNPKGESRNAESDESQPVPTSEPGAHLISGNESNASGQQSQHQAFPQARSLPVTGFSTGFLLTAGMALLGVIAGGVYYAWRRKSAGISVG